MIHRSFVNQRIIVNIWCECIFQNYFCTKRNLEKYKSQQNNCHRKNSYPQIDLAINLLVILLYTCFCSYSSFADKFSVLSIPDECKIQERPLKFMKCCYHFFVKRCVFVYFLNICIHFRDLIQMWRISSVCV